jgi:hypothetical protein
MPALVGLPFAQTFSFSRPVPAPVRNPDGVVAVAAADVPRFDHHPDGKPRGLLVEGGGTLGQSDRCRALPGDWEVQGEATVFHEFEDAAGDVHRRAFFSTNARRSIDALLSSVARHRRIGAVAGYLRNHDGLVRYRDMEWRLPAAIAIAAPLVLGDDDERVLVDG